jgi:hypothetical protein
MSVRPMILAAALAAVLAACAPVPSGMGYAGPAMSTTFSAEDFAWSTMQGQASIEGRIDFTLEGVRHDCVSSVGLTPDTPYTRARFATLYGSTNRAAVPASIVRARTVDDANADYRGYVRSASCDGNRFSFTGLPDGSWFVIAPVRAGQEPPIVLMRRVQTRGGRIIQLLM